MLALATLAMGVLGFTSCKNDNGDGGATTGDLKLNYANIEITVGEELTVTASGAEAVTWEIAANGAIEATENGLSVEVKGVKAGEATLTAKAGEASATCTIYVTGKPAEEQPEVAAPAADQTKFLVRIDGVACEEFELYMLGLDGEWADNPEKKFTRVEGTEQWFELTYRALTVDDSNFKPRANGSWDFESKDGYNFLGETANYIEGGADGGNSNNLMVKADADCGGKILAFEIIRFVTPCVESVDYTITVKTSYCGAEGTDVAITGNIPGTAWDQAVAMTKVDETTYTFAVSQGLPGQEFKFQSTEGGWANQPQEFVLNAETGAEEWGDLSNFQLGDETNIVIDLTDAAKYRWSACAVAE